MKHTSNKLTTKEKCELKRRALAGESIVKLAAEYGVNETTVCYHLRRARADA